MSALTAGLSSRAAELRERFDRSFAESEHVDVAATEDFIAIHVGGDPYLLRLTEIGGLYADRKVTRLPSSVAELSGLAAFRGSMAPVYDLAKLLRYPASPSPRWMVMVAGTSIALAFNTFDGHARFPRNAIASSEAGSREHVREVLRAEHIARPIIDLPSVVAAVRKYAPATASKKEH